MIGNSRCGVAQGEAMAMRSIGSMNRFRHAGMGSDLQPPRNQGGLLAQETLLTP
jgi:hypothetical protein